MPIWADYPFPLISTPAVTGGYRDAFIKSASKMALVHNVIIRGMNAMYLQCEYVTPNTAYNFLTFCQCWSEMLHNHHACEEVAYFPIIEKACGIEGIAEDNVDQHEAFMPGLRKFDDYVYRVSPFTFSGQRLVDILDSFAASLQIHLTDEVVWILSLSKYPDLDLAAIDVQHGNYVRTRSSKTRLLPYLLTNHDLTYEEGIHAWWPTGNTMRDWFLRYVCTIWHRGAWEYSSCSLAGKPQKLHGINWDKLVEGGVSDRPVYEIPAESTATATATTTPVEMQPQKPQRAYTRSPSPTSPTTPRSSIKRLV